MRPDLRTGGYIAWWLVVTLKETARSLRIKQRLLPEAILLLPKRFKISLYTIQAMHAILELLAQPTKQWSGKTIFELIERAHDPIRLLARLNVVDQTIQPKASARQRRHIFGKHTREKKRVVADMLAHLSLALKRSGIQQRVGLDQHLTDLFQPLTAGIPDSIEVIDMNKVDQHIPYVNDHFVVCRKVPRYQFAEQPSQGVIGANRQN
jgi:hypothetical protein